MTADLGPSDYGSGDKNFFLIFLEVTPVLGMLAKKIFFRKNFENFYKSGQVTTVLCLCSKISKFGEIARLWTTRFENFPSIKNVQVSFFFWS